MLFHNGSKREMMKPFAILIAFSSFFLACRTPGDRPSSVTAAEYQVYGAIIDSLTSGRGVELVLVHDSTLMNAPMGSKREGRTIIYNDPGTGMYAPQFPGSVKDLWPDSDSTQFSPDLSRRNATRAPIVAESLHVRAPVKYIDFSSIRTSAYGPMYEQGTLGLFWFSRVAFGQRQEQALVYCEYMFHELDGEGAWCWMKFQAGRWVIYRTRRTWVS
jgi:hypothetical protein